MNIFAERKYFFSLYADVLEDILKINSIFTLSLTTFIIIVMKYGFQ